ncbi:CoA transferase [bacterium]|nr:CoA transferase [bacterium]
MGPLSGVRVLDLTKVLAGPFATQTFGDFGADVIKIERPVDGDDTRAFGPPFVEGESTYFLSINRGKRSLALNLKSAGAVALVKKIAAKSDVLIENFRPGSLKKMGLDYESLHAEIPRLIYVSISGFGATGPDALRPGYDLAVQGLSGMMSITGYPGGPPTKVGTSIADLIAGLYAVQGTLLALVAREKTGRGQFVDVSMLDGQLSLLTFQGQKYLSTGAVPTRLGNQHPSICPYETFASSDGYFNVAVGNDRLWESFCGALDRGDLATDPRFKTNPDRVKNHDALFPILQELFKTRSSSEWIGLLEKAGVPAAPILTVDQALGQAQVRARNMRMKVPHSKLPALEMTGVPVKLSDTPAVGRRGPPVLGEHTAEILAEFGLDAAEVESLKQEGAFSR